MESKVDIKHIYSKDIFPFIDQLAALRMEVFRDYPYLYEGSLDYEKKYLSVYTQSSRSVLVGAFDGEKMIGAATALPLMDEADYVQAPFIESKKISIEDIYYFGESVLLKNYRGMGIGHHFFDGRESAAKKFHFNKTAFCSVIRPMDHQLRPIDYKPLDEFWIKRGYRKNSSLTSSFSWIDINEKNESMKEMVYWMKDI